MEIHCLQKIGLNQNGTDHVALDPYHRNLRIAHCSFPEGIHIPLPLIIPQIVTELLAHSLHPQPRQVAVREMIIQQKTYQLMLAAGDGISLLVRVFAEEHVKYHDLVLESMHEEAVGHGEFIEIRDHRRIVIILIRNIRHCVNLCHTLSPIHSLINTCAGAYTCGRSFHSDICGPLLHSSCQS